MGIAADSLFNVLMSWVRALVNALWALFSADRTTALEFLGKNWMMLAVVIIVCGLVIDWLVWLIRWQPYHIWARKVRRLLRLDEPDEEEPKKKAKAHAAVMPENRYARPVKAEPDEETPLYLYGLDEEEKQEWTDDAWQLQMQEDARARAEAEKAEREREVREAEQARLAQEAYEAEQARLAQEAYEAEQARLAQEEYERQMEEYERQKAQYALDLAEYERQKAEYEAQLAAQQAYESQQQDVQSSAGAARRRRTAAAPQEDAVTQEIRIKAPARPAKTESRPTKSKPASPSKAQKHEKNTETKTDKSSGLLSRMAKMIEPEEEEIITRKTLPPRVDMNDAFRTAKLPIVTPPRNGRRKK